MVRRELEHGHGMHPLQQGLRQLLRGEAYPAPAAFAENPKIQGGFRRGGVPPGNP